MVSLRTPCRAGKLKIKASVFSVFIAFYHFLIIPAIALPQSAELYPSLLQGRWWFRSLETSVNFNMNAQTQTFFPYNIYFTISGDNCELIRLKDIENFSYDTSQYLVEVEGTYLKFIPADARKVGNHLHRMLIKSIHNQTLTLEDVEGNNINTSLFLRNAAFTFTFARHNDSYSTSFNSQREITGKWYYPARLFEHILTDDSIVFTTVPFPDTITGLHSLFPGCDTNFLAISIQDETITYRDSLFFVNPDLAPVAVVGEPEPLFPDYRKNVASYYILPDKKIVEIEIITGFTSANPRELPMPVTKKVLFSYCRYPGKLVLRRHRLTSP